MARARSIPAMLSLMALVGAGCVNLRPVNEKNAPPGCMVYTTLPGDNPYMLAEKAYGHGWLAGAINEVNGRSPSDGRVFKTGTKIYIPPDMDGRPVDPVKMRARYEPGFDQSKN